MDLFDPPVPQPSLPFLLHPRHVSDQGDVGDDGIVIDPCKDEATKEGYEEPACATGPGPTALPHQDEEAVDDVHAHGEGGESQESEHGHLEEFAPLEEGDGVDPLGLSPKVPQLPQEAAD